MKRACLALALACMAMSARAGVVATGTIDVKLEVQPYAAVVIPAGDYKASYDGHTGTTATVSISGIVLAANQPVIAAAAMSGSTPAGVTVGVAGDSAFNTFAGNGSTTAAVTVTYSGLSTATTAADVAATNTLTITLSTAP